MSTTGHLIVTGVLLVILLLMIIPLKFHLLIRKNSEEDYLVFSLGLGLWHLPFLKINSLFSNWTVFLLHIRQYFDWDSSIPKLKELKVGLPSLVTKLFSSSALLKKAEVRHLEWSTKIGIANPAVTGIAVGSLWHLKHRFYRYLVESTAGVSNVPAFAVVPDFYDTGLELEFRCIFALRGGHIITAAGQVCWFMLCSFLRGDRIEQPSH